MVLEVPVPPLLIGGDVDAGYGSVADVFRRNMFSGKEIGAAIAVYRAGSKLSICGADFAMEPLELDFFIGLPASVDRDRVAHSHGYSRSEMLLPYGFHIQW